MDITANDLKTGKIELPSLKQEIQMAGLEDCDLKLIVEVFNKYFDEPKLDVDLPLYQCISCKKLIEIKRGWNECKTIINKGTEDERTCGRVVNWSKI